MTVTFDTLKAATPLTACEGRLKARETRSVGPPGVAVYRDTKALRGAALT